MKRSSLSLAVIGLILASLAIASSSAAAETLNFRPAGEIVSAGRINIGEGETRIECRLRLVGTLARSVTTRAGEQMGSISSVAFEECSGEPIRTLEIISPLPIRFDSTLNSERTLVGYLVKIESIGILINYLRLFSQCLYSMTLGILERVNRDGSTGGEIFLNLPLTLVRSLVGILCPLRLSVGGFGTLTPTQTVTLT
jgi:hypothetical protein